jgi:hypothetical protein
MSVFAKLEELILPHRCRQSERIRTTPDSRPDDLFFLAVVIPHGEMLFEAALRIFGDWSVFSATAFAGERCCNQAFAMARRQSRLYSETCDELRMRNSDHAKIRPCMLKRGRSTPKHSLRKSDLALTRR